MKNNEIYKVGQYLWRKTDNALFQVTCVSLGETYENAPSGTYALNCVNHMCVREKAEREPEQDLLVSIDAVHSKDSIYTPFQPSKAMKGQHVWNLDIIDRCSEFVIEGVEEHPETCSSKPCLTCHNGKCEQCNWGYRSAASIAEELKSSYKKAETIYTMVSVNGHEKYRCNAEDFPAHWSMLPQMIRAEMMNANIKTEDESEEVVNKQLEKEATETGVTVENSYEKWKKNLKVISVSKFDHDYFRRGLCYHVQKRGYGDGEFYGIMVDATEDLLKVLKLGTHIHYETDVEIVEIPLKEYMDGRWSIVRLTEEV